ncbi:hypothetical protein [Hansschlegelia sp.]|uniref:BatD family protein n=1 Tax=Hansschlegelia sp. TaxID=2041892 RepID=UPI002CF0FEE6|nr:hypothetical protein [Hansschlegelia sp.]HVI29236.1 hypothetical protein [Hansschlegelia sp.]
MAKPVAAALAILMTGFVLAGAPAAAQDRTIFDDVKLEVLPETHGVDPYPNELILVRIRGTYRPKIKIQHLLQPSLTDFGWMHLTKDKAFETTFGGFSANGYERVIAVFAEKSGPLTIGSFTHKLSVVDGVGSRELEVKSAPVTINIAKWTGAGGPSDPNVWWLPASEVRVTDEWASDPNHVPRGETTRRTVTIEAVGVTAEQLPPPPVMRSPGVISFRGPTERDTKITENGPIARAVYRWDMRPTTAAPAIVEPVQIPWFDTVSRTMRTATIPAQRMAWAAAASSAAAAAEPERPAMAATLAAGVIAFIAGAALLLAGGSRRSLWAGLPPRALWKLKAAARRADAAETRAAISELARAEPERSAAWSGRSDVRAAIAELDRHLYDNKAAPPPDLRRLARTVVAARRSAAAGREAARSGLAPLDGPMPAKGQTRSVFARMASTLQGPGPANTR